MSIFNPVLDSRSVANALQETLQALEEGQNRLENKLVDLFVAQDEFRKEVRSSFTHEMVPQSTSPKKHHSFERMLEKAVKSQGDDKRDSGVFAGSEKLSPIFPSSERGMSSRDERPFHALRLRATGTHESFTASCGMGGFVRNCSDPRTDNRPSAASENRELNSGEYMAGDLEFDSGVPQNLLPPSWPETVRMHQKLLADQGMKVRSEDVTARRHKTTFSVFQPEKPFEDSWVVHPNSAFTLANTMTTLIVLVYELSLTPVLLAWEIPLTGFLLGQAWLLCAFWTTQLVLGFRTGFYQHAEVVLRPTTIASHYLKSWFLLDIVAVAFDWINIMSSSVGFQDVGQSRVPLLRVAKFGRLLRLISVMRTWKAVLSIADLLESLFPRAPAFFKHIILPFLTILWGAHVMSCAWYWVGQHAPSDTGGRWPDGMDLLVGDDQFLTFKETGAIYQYWTSFHWAMGQIALGEIDSTPKNTIERVFTVLAMVVGFIFGSSLVSSLSAAMVDWQMMRKDETEKIRMLRQYLRENGVAAYISIPVQDQAHQRLRERQRVMEDDVKVLEILSNGLRQELRFAIQQPHLARHELLRLWMNLDAGLMQRICMNSIDFTLLRAQDELFAPGGQADSCHMLKFGQMLYVQDPYTSFVKQQEEFKVEEGARICEVAMWCSWTHVGRLEAKGTCELLSIRIGTFFGDIHKNKLIKALAVEYGRHFHRKVQEARPPVSEYPDDLFIPSCEYTDIVGSLSGEARRVINRDAWNQLTPAQGKKHWRLRQELLDGQSLLVSTGDGELLRVVSVICLEVERWDRKTLVQIGKTDGYHASPLLQLPGTKQAKGEGVRETMARLFNTKCKMLANKVEKNDSDPDKRVERLVKESRTHEIMTKYIRHVRSAKLKESEQIVCERLLVCRPVEAPAGCKAPFWNKMHYTEVIPVWEGHYAALYAWLDAEDFQFLRDQNVHEAELCLKTWLQKLEPLREPESPTRKRRVWGSTLSLFTNQTATPSYSSAQPPTPIHHSEGERGTFSMISMGAMSVLEDAHNEGTSSGGTPAASPCASPTLFHKPWEGRAQDSHLNKATSYRFQDSLPASDFECSAALDSGGRASVFSEDVGQYAFEASMASNSSMTMPTTLSSGARGQRGRRKPQSLEGSSRDSPTSPTSTGQRSPSPPGADTTPPSPAARRAHRLEMAQRAASRGLSPTGDGIMRTPSWSSQRSGRSLHSGGRDDTPSPVGAAPEPEFVKL